MNPLSFIYHELLFRPLFNLLVGITNLLPAHNVGLSILVVTVLVRLILLPPSFHQAKQMQKNQAKMSAVKDQIKKIRRQHKNDKTKQAEATLAVYRQAGINPASGCLPLLIQLPILIALYRVFFIGMGSETFAYLYSFITPPSAAQLSFIGINLTQTSPYLAVLAGIFQLILMRQAKPAAAALPSENDQSAQMMASMQKNMIYIFPVMTVFISLQLPAALALYWVASTIFGIVQQYIFKRYLKLSSALAV